MNAEFWSIDMFNHGSFYLGTLFLSIIAYLIGSINGGQILSLFGDKNLGEEGTKNYGATNAGRTYGKKAFALVFIFDTLKAVFTALILTILVQVAPREAAKGTNAGSNSIFFYASIPIAMIFVAIGHSWPLYFNFKGGKGVATSFGIALSINWAFALVGIAVFLFVILNFKKVSLGSLIGTLSGTMLILVAQFAFPLNLIFNWSYSWTTMISAVGLCFLVTFRHKSNIKRLINNKESKINVGKRK